MNFFKKLTTVAILVLLAACSRDRADGPNRTFGPQPGDNGPQSPQDVPELPNSLSIGKQSACARLESLRNWARDRDFGYSFLREIHPTNGKLVGGTDIAESPFTQVYFGEKFAVMSVEEFMKEVEKEYKAGNLSFLKYQAIQAAHATGSEKAVRFFQYIGTNDKLEQGFPGVFGKTVDLDKSLNFLLMMKASATKFDINQHARFVTARIPQFTSADWPQFTDDARATLQAIIKSGASDPSASDGVTERICGLVLWQRQFAQLLILKGYIQPELFLTEQGNLITKKVNKLSSDYPEFKKLSRAGAFLDPTNEKTFVLSADDVANYDANKKPLYVAAHVPTFGVQSNRADFGQTLNLLEGLVYMYAATSPAAPWVKKPADYVFGDIQDQKSPATVPGDAHSLALGLMRMNLKNLAKFHVVKLNASGGELKSGEALAGFIPMEDRTKGVSLSHVIQLTRIAVVLDQALGYFKNGTAETWAKYHPRYDRKTLAMLLGDMLIPSEEVKKVLSPEEYETILKPTLVNFRLPLATLLTQMATGEKCVSHLSWDLKTGTRKPTAFCDANEAKDAKAALRMLAMHIRAPFFYQKSLP
ncbi:MAG: hypothetical protein ABL958_06880 [Bdellovibrionia bacterium]